MSSAVVALPSNSIPPLRTGDRMTRAEFERRWEAAPQIRKAELIEGVAYVQAALRHDQHGEPHFLVMTWLGVYASATPGVGGGDNSSLRLDDVNEPQPDALLRLLEERSGQSQIDSQGYLVGAPELVVEIAASTESYDLHEKLRTYEKHGVREYVVWRVLDDAIDWFSWDDGVFEQQLPNQDGIFKSETFPGLWLDQTALLDRDLARVLARLQEGLASDEHARFCRAT